MRHPDPPRAAAAITLCSSARLGHVRHQLSALAHAVELDRIVVWVGDDEPPRMDAEKVLHVRPADGGFRLAAARNAGARAAIDSGAELLVFLDADCVPGAAMLRRYREALASDPDAVLCGPVTYLPPGIDVADADALIAATSPHPARPDPPPNASRRARTDEYPLFWSLSFALSAPTWIRLGGFDESYVGYGGEDTDFAFEMRRRGVPLVWVGGAHAYHQHHDTQNPPWQHLDDILSNGARFAEKWGEWPMAGWLQAFAAAGEISWDGRAWRRVAGRSRLA